MARTKDTDAHSGGATKIPLDPATPLSMLMELDVEALKPSEHLEVCGLLVDLGGDGRSQAALMRAEALLDALAARGAAPPILARAHYYRANIWAHRGRWEPDQEAWAWSKPNLEAQVLELRRAVTHPGFATHHPLAKAQTFTNLGIALNRIGRFVEAIEAWDRALAHEPDHAMARGNRGLGLNYYAGSLFDGGHNALMACAARSTLRRALRTDALVESDGLEPAFENFAAVANRIEEHLGSTDVMSEAELNAHSLGRSKAERAYRRWCLDNRLFLNPLNDIGPHAIAAADSLNLPTITVPFDEGGPGPPPAIRYFNGLKQDFAAARFALFEGLTQAGVHYADREVFLYNTLDYPAVGQAVERTKMAFRGAYAIFDKVAFLLNHHLALGHAERRVSFRNLWFVGGKGKVLHPVLEGRPNWPLRGLYWLSKDIFEDTFRAVTEPDAEALYELRNHLEHKFVLVHDGEMRALSVFPPAEAAPGMFDLSFDSLIERTLRQLKLARAALIYVSLGIHAEERNRTAVERQIDYIPMTMDRYEDRWKRRD